MAFLGIDVGGTKVCFALFDGEGQMLEKHITMLDGRAGDEVGELIVENAHKMNADNLTLDAIGICIPGIYHPDTGSVWAPNISGWEDYSLLQKVNSSFKNIPVTIDSDRACYILGEFWQGNARGTKHAIYLSVGTGIGAGIMVDGKVLRGAHDIAGAIGWMALCRPYSGEYDDCGCFETYSSGEGIGRLALKYLENDNLYNGELRDIDSITAHHIFSAYENEDILAKSIIKDCIECWGMASANLVSLFNPDKIIFGGGVFGPAIKFIPQIKEEASKWAQPISMKQVSFESSGLGSDAGVYGAAFLALTSYQKLSN